MRQDHQGVASNLGGVVSESGVEIRGPWLDEIGESERQIAKGNDGVPTNDGTRRFF